MFYSHFSLVTCIFVTIVTSTLHSDPDSITESSITEAIQDAEATTAVDLGALLDAGAGAVVTLVAGDTRLAAHRAVLAARCPVLAGMIHKSAPGATSSEVSIPDIEGPVLRQLLAYLYTLQAPQQPGMAAELLIAADKYGLPALKADSEQQVIAHLSVETAAVAAVLAVRNNFTSLTEASIAFIKANIFHVLATEGWADTVRNHPEDLIKVMQLLSRPSAETSTPASADSGTSPASRPQSDDSQSPDPAAPPTTTQQTPTPDDGLSLLRNLTEDEKRRRLIEVAKQGQVDEVERLLMAGADVEARDGNERTALSWAASGGHVEVVRRLIAHGADVNARDNFWNTALHHAAINNHDAVVRLLAASSADLNPRSRLGRTPLHYAATYGHAEASTALLDAGADKGVKDDWRDTPLDDARNSGHQRLVEMLT